MEKGCFTTHFQQSARGCRLPVGPELFTALASMRGIDITKFKWANCFIFELTHPSKFGEEV